jgi:hypothetical protein
MNASAETNFVEYFGNNGICKEIYMQLKHQGHSLFLKVLDAHSIWKLQASKHSIMRLKII